MNINNHAKEAIAHCGFVLWCISVLGASVYLSVHTGNYHWMWLLTLLLFTQINIKGDPTDNPIDNPTDNPIDNPTDNQWHSSTEKPEERTYVLAYNNDKYYVMFYRDSMYECPDLFVCNRVDRWMYIPGNTNNK